MSVVDISCELSQASKLTVEVVNCVLELRQVFGVVGGGSEAFELIVVIVKLAL